jgi:hypothetical protein
MAKMKHEAFLKNLGVEKDPSSSDAFHSLTLLTWHGAETVAKNVIHPFHGFLPVGSLLAPALSHPRAGSA